MSIRKVVAGLLIIVGIAIMAVPFFWRATGEKQTVQLISEFEQTLEDDYDEETDVEAGDYVLVTGTRLASGAVLSKTTFSIFCRRRQRKLNW